MRNRSPSSRSFSRFLDVPLCSGWLFSDGHIMLNCVERAARQFLPD
jgi:hypothetical protein